jgi:hypothetical protein
MRQLTRDFVRGAAKTIFGKLVESVEGPFEVDRVGTAHRFLIHLVAGEHHSIDLSFKQLQALAEALGTRQINVATQFDYDYSEVTPGPGNSCYIEAIFPKESRNG